MTARLDPFEALFGRPSEVTSEAPGRVNLMGEHTDYNGGLVLPAVLPLRTRVEAARRDDDVVEVASDAVGDHQRLAFRLGGEAPERNWLDYPRGATVALRNGGHVVHGASLRITSNVPLGGGLSSSASLVVAVLRALRWLYALGVDDRDVARMAHQAEHDFVGAPVGAMDPTIVSLGSPGAALRIDTLTLDVERVSLPRSADFVVIGSGVVHQHAHGSYRVRRDECERAARAIGVPFLSALRPRDLTSLPRLDEPLGRRVRHVVTENARVEDAVRALREGDLASLGAAFRASHESQRDDFEVSVPEVDTLVSIAKTTSGVHGARLTGGGFGGAVVVIADAGRGRDAARGMVAAASSAGIAARGLALLEGETKERDT